MMSDPTFYTFTDNSAHTRGYAWAARIVPRSPMVHRVCTTCGAIEHYPSGAFDVIIESGSTYPDVLGCGAYPFLIVAERVVAAWRAAGVTSFHTFPVGVAAVTARRLRNVAPPGYVRIELDGSCQIDLLASGIAVARICPECHRVLERPVLSHQRRFIMKPGSWDGSPLFRDALLYPHVSFCTRLILEIARDHQLTNFRFEPMEGPLDSTSKGIDYLRMS